MSVLKSSKHLLLATVFITGASVLVVELVATRILSPFFGNTIFTVSGVISIVLGALSIGYFVGGRLADKSPSLQQFFGIIFAGGFALLFTHVFGVLFLPILGYVLPLSYGPLVASLLLFALPTFLLGMLSPYAIKLYSLLCPVQGIGRGSGEVFFWSTVGSIVGSISTGLFLIPTFGIAEIVVANAVMLMLLGGIFFLFCDGKIGAIKFFSLVVFLIIFGFITAFSLSFKAAGVVHTQDGIYERITISDGHFADRPARKFQQDRSLSGVMFLDAATPQDLAIDYTKYAALYEAFGVNLRHALVIGGGTYTVPKFLLESVPNAEIDVVEIEPELYGLAQKYFGLRLNERLHNFIDDGRRFLRMTDHRYDLIFSDVYYSLFSIPAHFTTQEFYQLARSRLNDTGIFIANMIGSLSRQEPSLLLASMKTFQTIFPNSYFYATMSPISTEIQNIMFVGVNGDVPMNFDEKQYTGIHSVLRTLSQKNIDIQRFDLLSQLLLTDNYAPVDYMTSAIAHRSFAHTDILDGREMMKLIAQQLAYGARYPTAHGHKKVVDFLVAEMKALTNDVRVQTWQHKDANGASYPLTNIIARLHPEIHKRVIVAAHFDTQKISFKNKDNQEQPSLGANNNASGVAVLIELARALAQSTTPLKVGVDIVFFDGEEGDENQGADFSNWKPHGSTYFVEHLREMYGDVKPVGGIVLDMVGDKNLKLQMEPNSLRDAPAAAKALWKIGQKISPTIFQTSTQRGIQDDHTPLNGAGIPSVLMIDYDYPAYATTDDTLDQCSAESLRVVAQTVYDYLMYEF